MMVYGHQNPLSPGVGQEAMNGGWSFSFTEVCIEC